MPVFGGFEEQYSEYGPRSRREGALAAPERRRQRYGLRAPSGPRGRRGRGSAAVNQAVGTAEEPAAVAPDQDQVVAEGVLEEVLEIFPSRYIHIGGDEAPKRRWRESAEAQAVMRRDGGDVLLERDAFFAFV